MDALATLAPFGNLFALTLALGTPFALCVALERVSTQRFARERRRCGRIGLSSLPLLTASAHLTDPGRMTSMLPAWVAGREAIVLLTELCSRSRWRSRCGARACAARPVGASC